MSEGYDQIFDAFTQLMDAATAPAEHFSGERSSHPAAMRRITSADTHWMRDLGIGSSVVGVALLTSVLFQKMTPRRATTCLIAGIGFSAFGVSQLAADVLGSYFPPCDSTSSSIIEQM